VLPREPHESHWPSLTTDVGVLVEERRDIERTLAWIDQNRRMAKDYEKLCASGEALVYAAMSRLMLRRLPRV
jgi:transposase